MWNNPRLLNATAGALFALGVAYAIVFAARYAVLGSPRFALHDIVVDGAPAHTSAAEIATVARTQLRGNFFGANLDVVRAALERLPWVRRAALRRVWPDRIEVSLEEHVALARWGDEAQGMLVDTYGERFAARTDEPLPRFDGPAGSEALVTERYRVFSVALAPLGSPLQRVVLSPRYSWQLTLQNGLHVALGRDLPGDALVERLERFALTFAQTEGAERPGDWNADLRYPNGYALRERPPRGEVRPEPRAKG